VVFQAPLDRPSIENHGDEDRGAGALKSQVDAATTAKKPANNAPVVSRSAASTLPAARVAFVVAHAA